METQKQSKPWLDLSAHGARLAAFVFPEGAQRHEANLILIGVNSASPEWRKALAAGFMLSRSGRTLYREGAKYTRAEMVAIFPRAIVRPMTVDEIILRNVETQEDKTAVREARSLAPLGLNHLGQEVFEGETGRFVRAAGNEVVRETALKSPAMFLRASTPEDLALCADGFVEAMVRGQSMRPSDVRRFSSVVHGLAAPMEDRDERLPQMQEAIEAATQRRLHKEFDVASPAAFQFAVDLLGRQPTAQFRTSETVMHQQFSTVLPMSIAAQRILGDTSGRSLLEPTIGNGSLVMCVPQTTRIVGVEIDPARAAQVGGLRDGMQIRNADFLIEANAAKNFLKDVGHPEGFDFVIANPPFGGLKKPIKYRDELNVTRLDHMIVLKALDARKDDGRGVFIIGADRENIFDAHAGEIVGGSKSFFAWLADHYEIEDAVELAGSLYAKQGASYPVRMITVGRRRSDEDARRALKTREHRLPERIPVIRDWSALYAHVDTLATRLEVPPVEPFVVTGEETSGEDSRKENAFQVPYQPMSRVGEATSMVPANMVASISVAFDRFLAEHEGGVDAFIATALRIPVDDLELYFSPEQIDAIALSIDAFEKKRGFIVGDQTGQGKGRILAGLVRYCAIRDIPVTFLTEKPNLFTDFWRDLRDVGAEAYVRPAIMNSDAAIRDMETNRKVVTSVAPAELKSWMANDLPLPKTGYNLLMATYSQFNRSQNVSAKSAWLPAAAKDGLLILDESHNATGESNTNVNVSRAVEAAASVSYSSATYAKGAKNMAAYSKVFPPSVSTTTLPDTLKMGGEPLAEILSSMLVEEGVMIRRERDMSRLAFGTEVDTGNLAANEERSDRLAEILLAMSALSGDVQQMSTRLVKEQQELLAAMSEAQRKGSRMGVSYTNFGSRLYTVMRQFMLAIKTDFVADLAVKAIREGKKPVIATEQTNETMIREAIFDSVFADYDADTEEGEDDELMSEVKALTESAPLPRQMPDRMPTMTFRDLMLRLLDRIQMIQERNDYGVVSMVHGAALADSEEEKEAFEGMVESIRDMIARFPDLPLSPVDRIKQRLAEEGFSCGEVSGRQIELREMPEGDMAVKLRSDDRLSEIYKFQNGEHDAVVITRAGAAGLSLHSSERVKDQRQRVMYELQIMNSVDARVQMFGRVDRRGQVCDPEIVAVMSGLPSEMRTLAMQNAKLAGMSANTQSNRSNMAEMKDVPDILNEVGNKVCRRLLEENPEIAVKLDINVDEESDEKEDYYVNRLTGRLCLLTVVEQKRMWGELAAGFNTLIAELDAQGRNPLRQSIYDWRATEVAREILSGVENESAQKSVFDRPVYVSTLRWKEEVEPKRWADVQLLKTRGEEALAADSNVIDEGDSRPYSWMPRFSFEPFLGSLETRIRGMMQVALPKEFNTIEEALRADKGNVIQRLQAREKQVQQLLTGSHSLIPGRHIEFSGAEGEATRGVVVGIRLPGKGREAYLGEYEVRVVVPGETHARMLTFNQIAADASFKALSSYENLMPKHFDDAPSGTVVRERQVLTGNLFVAAQMAAESQMGHAGIFTDENGIRNYAIILPRHVTREDMLDACVAMSAGQTMMALELFEGKSFKSIGLSQISIARHGTDVVLVTPGSKSRGGHVFANEKIVALTGSFSGSREAMRVTFPVSRLAEVAKELGYVGVQFSISAKDRYAIDAALIDRESTKEKQAA